MIPRHLAGRLEHAAASFPIVCVTGPRQSGKTTLGRAVFAHKPYVSLEAPDVRQRAASDPRGLLAELPDGAFLDEVQRVPELLSYLQVDVDERRIPGRWVVSGSANFALLEGLSQSLAGRAAVLTLLPLSSAECPPTEDLWSTLLRGGYPAVHAADAPVADWLASYVATYVERDVRQLLGVGNLTSFQTFLGLCAGRAGQLVNLSALGADAGITHGTARAWLTVLEASYVASRVAPWSGSHTSRLVKSPKLQFVDSGLHTWLLGVRDAAQLRVHPLRGAVFESWVVAEIAKARLNAGLPPDLHFWRDHRGLEADVLVGRGVDRVVVEVKAGATVAADWLDPLRRVCEQLAAASPPVRATPVLVYGGEEAQTRDGVRIVPWSQLSTVDFAAV